MGEPGSAPVLEGSWWVATEISPTLAVWHGGGEPLAGVHFHGAADR
jgi:hypothetical protein